MTIPLVAMRGIGKSFAGVTALSGIDIDLRAGEVHALLGENGAGKSTLIKILMGVHGKDAGRIEIDGVDREIASPFDAQAIGLAAVYQDVALAPHLSVAENFFMGRLPLRRGFVDWTQFRNAANAFLTSLGIDVDVRAKVSSLTIARQQLVAIAKVVWTGARLMIFDEPTALLTNSEVAMLFGLIRRLKADGKAIMYVSHRMEEIFEICDRATVLRDGRFVRTVAVADTTPDALVAMMVGRALARSTPRATRPVAEVVLELRNVSARGRFRDVTFTLSRGEILGFYGLVGAGRTEVMRVIFGADSCDHGEFRLKGRAVRPRSPSQMIRHGLGLVTEDRKNQSLAMPMDVVSNMAMVSGGRRGLGWLNRRAERVMAEGFVKQLRVRTPSIHQTVLRLSGGNQQKVVIAKWLSMSPDVLIFDEPTIGVDVASRAEIYALIRALAESGRGIIVVSSYLPEVIELSDRILVMHEGEQIGVCPRAEASEERLLGMASKVILPVTEAREQGLR
jgi:ribose transport system ATP-binding protein